MQEKILRLSSTLPTFEEMRKKYMGSLGGIIKMIPGMNKLSDDQLKQGETQLKRSEAMINSMTSRGTSQSGFIGKFAWSKTADCWRRWL